MALKYRAEQFLNEVMHQVIFCITNFVNMTIAKCRYAKNLSKKSRVEIREGVFHRVLASFPHKMDEVHCTLLCFTFSSTCRLSKAISSSLPP